MISKINEVEKFNTKKFNELKTEKYWIAAQDTFVNNSDLGKTVHPQFLYSEVEKCGGMHNDICLAVGTRVMLRRNLDTPNGLVSGSMGTVEGFMWPILARRPRENGQLPDSVIIRFDDPDIALKMQNLSTSNGCIKIEPYSVVFQGKKGKTISRHMLPLIHCWAVTIHKMQSTTLNKAVVDLDCFGQGLEYVALSRVKTMEGLAVSRIATRRFFKNTIVCKDSLKELGIEFKALENEK